MWFARWAVAELGLTIVIAANPEIHTVPFYPVENGPFPTLPLPVHARMEGQLAKDRDGNTKTT